MRKCICIVVLLLVITLSYASVYATGEVTKDEAAIVLNGTQIDTNAYINKQTIYLPIRSACEALGYQVSWKMEKGASLIPVKNNKDEIVFDMTNEKVSDNGHSYYAYGNNEGICFLVHNGKAYIEADLFSDIFAVNAKCDNATKQVTLNRMDENNITITTEKKDVNRKDLVMNFQYPKIDGLNNDSIEAKINAVFKKAASDAEAEGLKNASELADSGYAGPNICGTDLNYIIKYNQNGLLSVILDDYQYAAGAHGGITQSSYTFDLKTGEALKLSDLLNPNTKYTDYVNAFIRSEIDKRTATGDVMELTTFKTVGNNPSYYLSNDSVVFYFQQYEYFPYAAGIQEFAINFSALKDKWAKGYEFLYKEPVSLSTGKSNTISVGDVGQIVLKGNPTTGYGWHCTIADSSKVSLNSQDYVSDSIAPGIVGVGGNYAWNFKALKAGTTTITFKYYRDWEGESSTKSEDTVTYTVIIK